MGAISAWRPWVVLLGGALLMSMLVQVSVDSDVWLCQLARALQHSG